jgi:hypothetical protein
MGQSGAARMSAGSAAGYVFGRDGFPRRPGRTARRSRRRLVLAVAAALIVLAISADGAWNPPAPAAADLYSSTVQYIRAGFVVPPSATLLATRGSPRRLAGPTPSPSPSLTVAPCDLAVSPDSITVASDQNDFTFTLAAGADSLTWQAAVPSDPAVTLEQSSGALTAGQSAAIGGTIGRTVTDQGSATISYTATCAGSTGVTRTVSLTWQSGTQTQPPPPPGTLVVSPTDLALGGCDSQGTLTITAEGGPIDWQASTTDPTDVTLTSSDPAQLAAGQSATVTVSVNRATAPIGDLSITVTTADGQTEQSNLSWVQPWTLDTDTLNFDLGHPGSLEFNIVPSCASDLTFQITSSSSAISVSPTSGSLQDGQNIPITVTPDQLDPAFGSPSTITVTTSDGLTQNVSVEYH